MRKNNLKLFRAQGWFSFTRLITCSNTSDIKGPWPDSDAEDDAFVPLQYEKLAISHPDLSGRLENNENLSFKKKRYPNLSFNKKRWISHVVRRRQSTGVVPNSRVKPKIKKAKHSDIEAAASHDGQIQNNTPVMLILSVKESTSAVEFEKPKIDVELRIARTRAIAAVADACEQFRNFAI